MSVTKAVMAAGGFTVNLIDGTPTSVTDAAEITTKAFSSLVVTPTWLDPNWCSASSLRAQSVFTGVLFGRTDRTTLVGHHATVWANDPSGIGEITERGSATLNSSFRTWMRLEIPDALTEGTISNIAPLTLKSWDPQKLTARERWDQTIDYFRSATGNASIEWQVDDLLQLNAGTTFTLYGSDLPVALLTPTFDGPDPILPGINADLTVEDDADDYVSRILFGYAGGGGVGVNGSNPYVDWDGNPVVRKSEQSDTSVAAGNATNIATSLVASQDQSRRKLTASTDRYCILQDVPCGYFVAAWDQEKGIVDLSKQYEWRGTIANPAIVRVVGVTMPLEAGMGVYLVNGGGTPTVTDLTPWVEWEAPGARLDLGALDRNYAYGVRSKASV